MYSNKSIFEALNSVKEQLKNDINCVKVGKVVAVNVADYVVDVEVMQTITQEDGEVLKDIVVPDVRVIQNTITQPIAVGDYCLLLCCDFDIEKWYINDQKDTDKTGHELKDCFALMGVNNKIKAWQFDNEAVCITYTLTKIKGDLEVSGNTKISGDTTIEGQTSTKGIVNDGTIDSSGMITAPLSATNGATGTFVDVPTGASLTIQNGIVISIA